MSIQVSRPRSWRASAVAVASGALLLTAFASGPISAQSPAAASPMVHTLAAATSDLGTFLTGDNGMTLYYLTHDKPGVSVCAGKCAENWPPLLLNAGDTTAAGDGVTGVIGAITREDGTTQATYDGWPLYYFIKDAKAGDTTGQDVGEVWFVAATDGSVPPAPVYTIAAATGATGTYLTGEDGKTLYFYSKDTTPGVATCADACLTAWPPYEPGARDVLVAGDGVTGVIGVAAQADGSNQVTYDGRPLYYFKDDAAAGDVKGQGVGGFFAATVDGSISTAP